MLRTFLVLIGILAYPSQTVVFGQTRSSYMACWFHAYPDSVWRTPLLSGAPPHPSNYYSAPNYREIQNKWLSAKDELLKSFYSAMLPMYDDMLQRRGLNHYTRSNHTVECEGFPTVESFEQRWQNRLQPGVFGYYASVNRIRVVPFRFSFQNVSNPSSVTEVATPAKSPTSSSPGSLTVTSSKTPSGSAKVVPIVVPQQQRDRAIATAMTRYAEAMQRCQQRKRSDPKIACASAQ